MMTTIDDFQQKFKEDEEEYKLIFQDYFDVKISETIFHQDSEDYKNFIQLIGSEPSPYHYFDELKNGTYIMHVFNSTKITIDSETSISFHGYEGRIQLLCIDGNKDTAIEYVCNLSQQNNLTIYYKPDVIFRIDRVFDCFSISEQVHLFQKYGFEKEGDLMVLRP